MTEFEARPTNQRAGREGTAEGKLRGHRSKNLLPLAGFLLLASPVVANAQMQSHPWGVFWQAAPSHWIELGKFLYGEETGKPIGDGDVLVATADVNQDTIADIFVYPLNVTICGEIPCPPRLYVFVDDRYHERIGSLKDSTKVLPDDIGLSPFRFGGLPSLLFDIKAVYWDGDAYALESTIVPTEVDASGFRAACVANPDLPQMAPDVDHQAMVDEYCGCVSYHLSKRRVDQAGFDALAADVTGNDSSRRLQTSLADSRSTCDLLLGFTPWPEDETYPPRNNDARAFFNTCRSQDWMADSYRVGSVHRANALCGCIAEGVATASYAQGSVDLLTDLYSGDKSDLEVEEIEPDLAGSADQIAEQCISQLRHADYTNGIDRPGSPKPPAE